MKRYDSMLPGKWDVFSPGARVVTTQPVLDFPLRPLPPGQTGTVIYSADDVGIVVRMDAHHPDLDEWDNCAHVCCDVRANPVVGDVPLRRMCSDDKSTWSCPYTDIVDVQQVGDRVLAVMVEVSQQAAKAQEMASHFKALGLNGPYDQLYMIAADLEDAADELNTVRVGYLGLPEGEGEE